MTVNPEKLRAFGIPLKQVQMAVTQSNQEVGASVIEMAEAEYMVRASGYIKSVQDLESVPLGVNQNGTPILLKDVAQINVGPQMRRGIAELNGEGETVGGVVVMRYGENAQKTIEAVKERLQTLKNSLPQGVEIVTVYDRSELIASAVTHLWQKLWQELLLVALVCVLFLLHVRSSLVAIVSLPVGVLAAFAIMYWQGLNANIMSLGGIAIAIGAMVDGAIVMIENFHKHMEESELNDKNRWYIVTQAAQEVGPSLFFSLLIITVSFVPVFTLEAQEGRMFSPLAYTKTYAMAAAAILAVTLVPVLIGYFIRGKVPAEHKNPINRLFLSAYLPVLRILIKFPKCTLLIAILVLASCWWPVTKMGSEFMPPLDEGDIMYMPTTYPALSVGKAREILQQTDKLIASVPEVDTVFGKIGRAETATDSAPMTMIETFIHFKPKDQWRKGLTKDALLQELNSLVTLPGVSNAWVMPIKTRIDMLATGIKTPVGIKISGPKLAVIQEIGQQLESILNAVDGTRSVYSERVAGGRYIKVDIQREKAARYGLNIQDIQQVVASAVGGMNVTQTVEGLERYPVNIRYPQAYRNSPEQLKLLPIVTPTGQHIALQDVASIYIEGGPPAIKSENARLNGWSLIDIENVDVGTYVTRAQAAISHNLQLPAGYSIQWSGQYEYMERAKEKLKLVIPMTLAIIIFLLYLNFRRLEPVLLLLSSLPFALVGSLWLLYLLGFNFSIAVAVGFIALAGVAVETGVIMLVNLDQAWQKLLLRKITSEKECLETLIVAASRRVRPVMMTAIATIVGLLPVMVGSGTGSEVMSRLAAPMVGGMLSTIVLTLWVIPVIFWVWKRYTLQ